MGQGAASTCGSGAPWRDLPQKFGALATIGLGRAGWELRGRRSLATLPLPHRLPNIRT